MTRVTKQYLDQYRQALLARHCLPLSIGADPTAARNRVYQTEDAVRRSVKAGSKQDLELSREMFKLHEHIRSLSPQQALQEQFAA